MNKILVVLCGALFLLAGCIEGTEDLVEDIVEEIVPGCNDESALNYDQSAENDLACLSQEVIVQSFNDFATFMDEGPSVNDTAGMTIEMDMTMTEEDGMAGDLRIESRMIVSPTGAFTSTDINFNNMMTISEEYWVLPNGDNTEIRVSANDEEFTMMSAMSYADTLAYMVGDSDEEEDHSEHDHEGEHNHSDDMDDDMEGDMDMEPDVEAPDLTEMDLSSSNFTMTIDENNSDEMYMFSTDLTVEGMTQTIELVVDSALVLRSVTIEMGEETVMMKVHTTSEIQAVLDEANSVDRDFSSMEALPFDIVSDDEFDLMDDEESDEPDNTTSEESDNSTDEETNDDGTGFHMVKSGGNSDALLFAGDFSDYHLAFANCTTTMDDNGTEDTTCEEPVHTVALGNISYTMAEAMALNESDVPSMAIIDMDESGSLTDGDMVYVNPEEVNITGDWNEVRLYSASADAYSDENPVMSLPGFTGVLATLALIGAAFIRKQD